MLYRQNGIWKCLLGMSALWLSLARPGQELLKRPGGRPRAWSQNPDSRTHKAWPAGPTVNAGCQPAQPRHAGPCCFLGFFSLSSPRMPPTSRDTGPRQRPQDERTPWPALSVSCRPAAGSLGTPEASRLCSEIHVHPHCSASAVNPGGLCQVKCAPLMFITKQPVFWVAMWLPD